MDLVSQEVSRLEVSKNLVVLLGRSRRMAVESFATELGLLAAEKGNTVGSSVPKTLGDVGAALVATGTSASLLIMQATMGSS